MREVRYLITGGCGFVGSSFINMLLESNLSSTSFRSVIINLDKLTYASNQQNISQELLEQQSGVYRFIQGDISDRELVFKLLTENNINVLVNFAAESHVERSVTNPELFVSSNYGGVFRLLEASSRYVKSGNRLLFHQISTDEVYGELQLDEQKKSTESDQLRPRSPYAAAKSGADLLIESYGVTYGLEYIITRSSNNFGPGQHEEKLIPKCIKSYLTDSPITIYGDGMGVRDWISTESHCQVLYILHKIWFTSSKDEKMQTIFNISMQQERTNISLVNEIQLYLNQKFQLQKDLIEFGEERCGNYRKYSLETEKLETFLNNNGVNTDFLHTTNIDFKQQLYKCIDTYIK